MDLWDFLTSWTFMAMMVGLLCFFLLVVLIILGIVLIVIMRRGTKHPNREREIE